MDRRVVPYYRKDKNVGYVDPIPVTIQKYQIPATSLLPTLAKTIKIGVVTQI